MKQLLLLILIITLGGAPLSSKTQAASHKSFKIEKRLDRREIKQKKYFQKKKALIQNKYKKRLKRIERRKDRISKKRYFNSKKKLSKWYLHQLNKIAYEEKNVSEKLQRQRDKNS